MPGPATPSMAPPLLSRSLCGLALLTVPILLMAGCEADSWFTPSIVGRWEPTPIKLPILNRLDLIDEPSAEPPNLTPVLPEDLEPHPAEYVMGSGDIVAISVLDLQSPGQEMAVQRQIDDLGFFRHPLLGPIKAADNTAAQLEEAVGRIALQRGMLKGDPQVTILVLQGQQNTFSIIGQPGVGTTRLGTYLIRGPDFRMLDATAMAGGIASFVDKLYIYRQADLTEPVEPGPDDEEGRPAADPVDVLLQYLDNGGAPAAEPEPPAADPPAPAAIEQSVEGSNGGEQWINVDGKWVPVAAAPTPPAVVSAAASTAVDNDEVELPSVVQRVIEVPYDRLREGDLRYNVVIRPGDIIRVPAQVGGSLYLMGMIARPGTYGLPVANPLTLKQLIAAAGGFGGIAVPERVDLIRRIGSDHEATVRLNLREIFEGNEPDIFLKPNDMINVGTQLPATPLAVIRSGFRFTYGFGFILDRNFGYDVFGNTRR